MKKYGQLDGAVNCAGSIVLKPGHLTSEDEFNETLKINLNSCFSLLRSHLPAIHFRDRF
jgi:NAD(P)-dependent dehydrogenase (short-subunit alcohol dehydrogenase family)